MIYVVNKHKHVPTPNDFYIGRGSVLGNPYTHLANRQTLAQYIVPTRQEAIEKYKRWLNMRLATGHSPQNAAINRLIKVSKQGDVYLVCYCKPQPCHGDFIKELVENIVGHEHFSTI